MRLADNPAHNPARRQELRSAFWPPPEAFDHPEIAKAIAEARSLSERAIAARQDAVEAETAVERAEQEDVAAHALAIRDGQAKPKPKALAAATKRKRAEDEAAALEAAALSAARDAVSALEEHGPGLVEQLVEAREDQIEALVAALDDVARRQGELQETAALIAYLRADEVKAWRGGAAYSLPPASIKRTSDDPRFAEVVEGLRRTAEGLRPQPEVERPDAQPLRVHPMRGAA